MPKRRANGEGNIRKRKDGRWEGRYTVGHDPETGKGHHQKRLGKTQAEERKAEKGYRGKRRYRLRTAKTYTVGSWLEVWMENYAKSKTQTVHVQDHARLSEKPHQAADRRHPAGRPNLSGLTEIL